MSSADQRSAAGLRDLRLLLPSAALWSGTLVGLARGVGWLLLVLVVVGVAATLAVPRRLRLVVAAVVALALVGGVGSALRVESLRGSLLARAAGLGVFATVEGTVSSDPRSHQGAHGRVVTTSIAAELVTIRGSTQRVHGPVLVVGDTDPAVLRLGARVRLSGRLAPSDDPARAALLLASLPPSILARPPAYLRVADGVRSDVRRAASRADPVARELVPGLVDGDDSGLPDDVVGQFQVAGLTHLTAVSGTNLTLVLGLVLALARRLFVRGRGLVVVGALGVLGFVVLARPEPSVLRAAVMGSVALLGLAAAARDAGLRTLSVAVVALLLLDPWLAREVGFALSVLATLGILVLGPPLRDALSDWLPRWLAEVLAVSFAAQLFCTPLIAAISGQVSLVAVLANVAVGWAVGPATVCGLVGGLLLPLWPGAGYACGRVAGLLASWIIAVAHRSADLPTAAIAGARGGMGLLLLVVVSAGMALLAPRFAARPARTTLAAAVLVVTVMRPLPTFGWPPDGWLMVACDVGQGDGLVLNAGARTALVVDTGPDPRAMDRCLQRLRVGAVPVVVLTHFHADHIGGLSGVLPGRHVREVDVTGRRDPPEGAAEVDRLAADVGATVRVPAEGEQRSVGRVAWRVVGPPDAGPVGPGPNNASLVLLAVVDGVRILLPGDAEPEAQRALLRSGETLAADILKVPHHGSRYQDATFLAAVGARVGVISVGADNDYGHPAGETLALLRADGLRVWRTDQKGDVAVVVHGGQLVVATRG